MSTARLVATAIATLAISATAHTTPLTHLYTSAPGLAIPDSVAAGVNASIVAAWRDR